MHFITRNCMFLGNRKCHKWFQEKLSLSFGEVRHVPSSSPAPPLFEALSHFLLLLMSWWKSVFVFKKYIVHFFLCYTGNWKQQKSSKKSKQMKACEPLIMENKEKTILSLAGCCNDDMMTFTYINISLSFFPPLWETFSAFSQTIDRKLVFRFHLYSRKGTAAADINQFC